MRLRKLIETKNSVRIAFLLGSIYAWPIFSKKEHIILAYSSYKIDSAPKMSKVLSGKSKYYLNEHKKKLQNFLGPDFKVLINSDIIKEIGLKTFNRNIGDGVSVILKNDIETDKIYSVIEKWLIDADDELKKWFLIGFMESRGSLDFTAKYYAIDIAHKDEPDITRRKLNRLNDIVGLVYNYNPRLLQENSSAKNDQFRLNLEYYAGHYGFFRPHIIEYYEKEIGHKLRPIHKGYIYIDSNYANKKLEIKTNSNLEINEFAVSLIGLSKEEKMKRALEYKLAKFDFDTEDEILYSSYNTKESAKSNAKYMCEIDSTHTTFTSKSNNKNYVEAHHLIPFSRRHDFDVNIDIEENLIALCPTCHRKIHLATDQQKKAVIDKLFEMRKDKLAIQMIDVNKQELYRMYGINI